MGASSGCAEVCQLKTAGSYHDYFVIFGKSVDQAGNATIEG